MDTSDRSATYVPALGQEELYGPDYFDKRLHNDPKRARQFLLEAEFMRRYVWGGRILDVGCSTGEFLETIRWPGERFGVEISAHARRIAEQAGISFDLNLFNVAEFFDCVVFRGTIQHIDEPFRFIKYANRALRTGGHLFFLATPNQNSPLYRLKKRLPFTTPHLNFYVPDDITLPNALHNLGYDVLELRFPYLGTPYCSPVRDHLRFVRNVFSTRFHPHAFWRSSMEIAAQKHATI
jgi:SAM-dependent methyltransferase